MGLEKYKKRRDFSITPEPAARAAKKTDYNQVFVLQEHRARNLHYDFRLEINGVLKSWAVPKGVPEKAGIKRLAIQTEDHPVEYAKFSGTIPEGLYGAGVVKIWDRGKYVPESIHKNKIVFELFGRKLKGKYVLIKTKFSKKSWLLFRKK